MTKERKGSARGGPGREKSSIRKNFNEFIYQGDRKIRKGGKKTEFKLKSFEREEYRLQGRKAGRSGKHEFSKKRGTFL